MGFAVRRVAGALALLAGLFVIGVLVLVAIVALSHGSLHVRGGSFSVVRDAAIGVLMVWVGSTLLRADPARRGG